MTIAASFLPEVYSANITGQFVTISAAGDPTSPINLYSESGFVDSSFARNIIRCAQAGSHSSSELSSLHIECRPVGSGSNNPNQDTGLSISTFKQSALTTSVSGEVEAGILVVRQGGPDGGGSDADGLIINVEHIGTCGSLGAIETQTSHFSRVGPAIDLQFNCQMGQNNTVSSPASYGFSIEPMVGTVTYGFHCNTGVANPFYSEAGFAVDSNCNVKVSNASGSIGYATGAGGAVTQITSITTTVVLNKICGQITTVSNAWTSGTAQTFTVTNSTVAIHDVVVPSIQSASGGGTYAVFCSTTGAGSFKLTVDPFVTATESLIINFAVIKAVSS